MDARGNKLSSCKIPDHDLKKTKNLLNFYNTDNFGLKKKEKKRIANTRVIYNTRNRLDP